MRALVFAAGLGTRLRPITDSIPKVLVPVAGKPVIVHVLDHLKKYGITQVAINTHWLAHKVMDYLGDRVLYSYEPSLFGTAGTIKSWLPWLGDDFLVMNGDTITDIDIEDFMNFHHKWENIATVSRNKGNDHCTGAMVFSRRINRYLPETGMIDDVLNEIDHANYYQCPHYFDIGSPERLELATKYYAK